MIVRLKMVVPNMQTSTCCSGTTSSASKVHGKDKRRQSSSKADQNWVCCQIGIYIQGICFGVLKKMKKKLKNNQLNCDFIAIL